MTNAEIMQELARAAHKHENTNKEGLPIANWEYEPQELRDYWVASVRAILRRLAELPMSDEMRRACIDAEDDNGGPTSYAEGMRNALRSLAGE